MNTTVRSLTSTPLSVKGATVTTHLAGACAWVSLQVYHEDEERFVVAGHEDDKAFNDEFWKKVLRSLCDPG